MDNELTALGIIFTEFYYWLTVVLMFLIHIGFCMYEVGVSRHKNHMHTLMKNTMLIPPGDNHVFLFWLVHLFCMAQRSGYHRWYRRCIECHTVE